MLNKKFKEVIKNLEQNLTNKDDLTYSKSQITELTMVFLDELDRIEASYQRKINQCESRMDNLENAINRIENDFDSIDEVYEDTDLEHINCPYCNTNFFIEFDDTKKEIKCPDCKNIIELDWGNFEDDM